MKKNIIKTSMKYKMIVSLSVLLASFFVVSHASAATFSVSPASASYNVGEVFTVEVKLDTGGASIDGVDVRYIRFNPNVLQVIDSNSSVEGIQVTPGTLMSFTPTNTVDNTQGIITFSQIVPGGQKYAGTGTLMSITFKALSTGSATVSFDASSGNTTDSNIASDGLDILTNAYSGQYALVIGQDINKDDPPQDLPKEITDFSALATNGKVTLSWKNPVDSSYVNTIIVRKQNDSPKSSIDGVQVYTGTGTSFVDTNVVNGTIYYYVAFLVSTNGTAPRPSASMYAVPQAAYTPTPSNPSSTNGTITSLNRTLSSGSTGADVKLLQLFLISKGYLAKGSAVSTFGPATQKAVQRYQKTVGIISSGTPSTTGYGAVGLKTRVAINAVLPSLGLSVAGPTPTPASGGNSSFTRDLSLGYTGADVMALQKILNSKGFYISTSGVGSVGQETTTFGPATKAALIRYQASKGISATGYFGPLTRASLSQ
jgi:peptidoglycan hydrolase-like protein with peptidoglycan-binding domain